MTRMTPGAGPQASSKPGSTVYSPLNRLDVRFEGETMKDRVGRREFLRVAGVSPGFGALYRVAPLPGADGNMKLTVVVE